MGLERGELESVNMVLGFTIKAYGQRASEISEASSITAEARAAYGVFASRVGADATSVWAAATSGSRAIALHLLACMLVKIWEGPEATSIWAKITEARKKETKDELEQNNMLLSLGFPTPCSCKTIPRATGK